MDDLTHTIEITIRGNYPHGVKQHSSVSISGDYRTPPTKTVIAARLRMLADDMEYLAACMDYYGGFAEWSKHGREIAGAGAIARQWADEIETSNAKLTGSGTESG